MPRPPGKPRRRNVAAMIKEVEDKAGKKVQRVEVGADGSIVLTFDDEAAPATDEWKARVEHKIGRGK